MEILQFLLNFFNNNDNLGELAPLFKLFEENNFDIKKVLTNLDFEKLAPILSIFSNIKGSENSFSEPISTLSPISSIADKDIIFALNRYFA